MNGKPPYTQPEAAEKLGLSPGHFAVLKFEQKDQGMPLPSHTFSGRPAYSAKDIEKLKDWYQDYLANRWQRT